MATIIWQSLRDSVCTSCVLVRIQLLEQQRDSVSEDPYPRKRHDDAHDGVKSRGFQDLDNGMLKKVRLHPSADNEVQVCTKQRSKADAQLQKPDESLVGDTEEFLQGILHQSA